MTSTLDMMRYYEVLQWLHLQKDQAKCEIHQVFSCASLSSEKAVALLLWIYGRVAFSIILCHELPK